MSMGGVFSELFYWEKGRLIVLHTGSRKHSSNLSLITREKFAISFYARWSSDIVQSFLLHNDLITQMN